MIENTGVRSDAASAYASRIDYTERAPQLFDRLNADALRQLFLEQDTEAYEGVYQQLEIEAELLKVDPRAHLGWCSNCQAYGPYS